MRIKPASLEASVHGIIKRLSQCHTISQVGDSDDHRRLRLQMTRIINTGTYLILAIAIVKYATRLEDFMTAGSW